VWRENYHRTIWDFCNKIGTQETAAPPPEGPLSEVLRKRVLDRPHDPQRTYRAIPRAHEAYTFSRPTRRTVRIQLVGNLRAPTASDIEGPTDLDWVSLCFETEISRCALDSCMAQERSNCLQIARAFQNVESLRPA
jgi:hypothetical protein